MMPWSPPTGRSIWCSPTSPSTSAPTNTWGLITNATLTIQNVDSVGTVQFSAPVYGVKKYAGYALIPVVRPGGSVGPVTVDYTTRDGTAVAGANYVGHQRHVDLHQRADRPDDPGADH